MRKSEVCRSIVRTSDTGARKRSHISKRIPDVSRPRTIVANLLLAAFGCALGLGVLEGVARWLLSSRPPGKSGEQAAYTIFDPNLGWRNKPGATVRYNRREYRTEVTINSLGFRDVERTISRPAAGSRVLVLGDSFVEAYTVERDESLTRRLESVAADATCAVDVVNAGVHGYSTDQEALWYHAEAGPMGADVVAIAVYYNDIIHNIRDRYAISLKPLLENRDGALVAVNTPLPERKIPGDDVAPAPPGSRKIEGSALKTLVLERLFTGAPHWYEALARAGIVETYAPDSIPDELRVYRKGNRNPEIERAWERTAEILGWLSETIRARGARPVLIHVPARFEVSDRAFDLTLLRYGLDRSAWDPGRVRHRLSGIAAEKGFEFLDLAPDLRASKGLLAEPYFPHDGHWNAKGHDVAARALFRFLDERKFLSCAKMGR